MARNWSVHTSIPQHEREDGTILNANWYKNMMMDTFSKEKRSSIMSLIRSKDTKPEIIVRKWLHAQGYRFRLHPKKLSGTPDIVLPKHKTGIFVNGCFWHRHEGCKRTTMPSSNTNIWAKKFEATIARDKKHAESLRVSGWKVIVIWECEVANGQFIFNISRAFSEK